MLSSSQNQIEERIVYKGHTFYRMTETRQRYKVSEHKEQTIINSLVDGGANGGFGGSDVRVVEYTDRYADVTGIDGHAVNDVHLLL